MLLKGWLLRQYFWQEIPYNGYMWKRRRFRKKIPRNLFKAPLLIFGILIIISISLYFKFKIFIVKQVFVEATQLGCVDEVRLKDESSLMGKNILFIDSSKVENNLKKKFFCIKSVVVSRDFFSKVKLQVSGRQPFAILAILKDREASSSALTFNIATSSAMQVQDFYTVDDEGVVFSKNTEGANSPVLYVFDSNISLGQKLENNLIVNCLKILDKVKTFGVEVNKSLYSGDLLVINPDTVKPKIVFHINEKVDVQLASLQLILNKAKIDLKELEFIDLRFDKPVVKFAPKKNGEK